MLYPCNIGIGRLGLALSQDFHTIETKLARLVIWRRAASVGGSCSSKYCSLLKSSHLTSAWALSGVDGMYSWQTKRSSFMYTSSEMVSLLPIQEKASSIGRSALLSVFQQDTFLFPQIVIVWLHPEKAWKPGKARRVTWLTWLGRKPNEILLRFPPVPVITLVTGQSLLWIYAFRTGTSVSGLAMIMDVHTL